MTHEMIVKNSTNEWKTSMTKIAVREYPTSQLAENDADRPYMTKKPHCDNAVLVVPAEGVVAVVAYNAFAVTVNKGSFGFFTVDWLIETGTELHNFVEGIRAAIAEADIRGFEIDPQFVGFRQQA
ncbi:unnamed protein product [marine sediment metagenome]|uniref:Uncharacterized protein n=1 Tax=marine sediment metagenome TaxID=412755 RepID=X1N6I0_9ZZZZ